MTTQVVRVWKGYGTSEGADRYCREHFVTTVRPQLQTLSGLLERFDDEVTHVTLAVAARTAP